MLKISWKFKGVIILLLGLCSHTCAVELNWYSPLADPWLHIWCWDSRFPTVSPEAHICHMCSVWTCSHLSSPAVVCGNHLQTLSFFIGSSEHLLSLSFAPRKVNWIHSGFCLITGHTDISGVITWYFFLAVYCLCNRKHLMNSPFY